MKASFFDADGAGLIGLMLSAESQEERVLLAAFNAQSNRMGGYVYSGSKHVDGMMAVLKLTTPRGTAPAPRMTDDEI